MCSSLFVVVVGGSINSTIPRCSFQHGVGLFRIGGGWKGCCISVQPQCAVFFFPTRMHVRVRTPPRCFLPLALASSFRNDILIKLKQILQTYTCQKRAPLPLHQNKRAYGGNEWLYHITVGFDTPDGSRGWIARSLGNWRWMVAITNRSKRAW